VSATSASNGLVFGVRGIVGKEVRSRTRGWRPMVVLTVYLMILTVAVVMVLGIAVSSSGTISPSLGQLLFGALAGGSVMLVSFIAPALTAGAISGERERLTLDLMLVTRASALGLVAGKLLGAMLWVLYLLVASLPALGIVYLFGGVPLPTIAAALVVTISTALGYTALGLVLSAVFRRTAIATVLAYGLVLVSMILLPILAASLGVTAAVSSFGFPGPTARAALAADAPAFGWPPEVAWLTFFSPAMALLSVLGGQLGQSSSAASSTVGLFSVYTYRLAGATGGLETVTSFAAWVFNALLSFGFAAVALLLATMWLGPRRGLARRRGD
jgi:ABC-type transport system involved in multi-copper enzyme maturation permease subunit